MKLKQMLSSLIAILMAVTMQSNPVLAAENHGMLQLYASLDKIEGFEANVVELSPQENARVSRKMDQRLSRVGFYDCVRRDHLREITDISFSPAKMVAVNNQNYSCYQFVKVYETPKNEIILVSISYDASSDSLLKVYAEKGTPDDGLTPYYDYSEYSVGYIRY